MAASHISARCQFLLVSAGFCRNPPLEAVVDRTSRRRRSGHSPAGGRRQVCVVQSRSAVAHCSVTVDIVCRRRAQLVVVVTAL